MESNPIASYISIKELFPEEEANLDVFKNYLSDISLTDSIIMCARINNIITHYNTERFNGQQRIVEMLMSAYEISVLNNVASRKKVGKNIVIFFRGQILELLRWIVLYSKDKPNDGETFSSQEIRSKFLRLLLMASDIWTKRLFANWEFESEDFDNKKKIAMGSFRKSTEDSSSALELAKSLGRGWLLFNKYLPLRFPSFKTLFLSTTGLTIEAYYSCLTIIITNFMRLDNTGIFNINQLDNVSSKDVLNKYFEIDCQNAQELRIAIWGEAFNLIDKIPDYNYRPMREKPIFKAEDGRAIILDPVFYSERLSIGPIFLLLNKACGSEIFNYFGYAFEDYGKDILNNMFNLNTNILTKRLYSNVIIKLNKGKECEMDACLNDVTELVLFEMKAVFMDDSSILSNKSEKLIELLNEKYGITANTKKGVGQLARFIEAIIKKKNEALDNCYSKIQVIYPVLLVHDTFLNTPLMGEFLSIMFREAIKPDVIQSTGGIVKGSITIKDLILMTIDELENLETSIQNFGFKDFLYDYTNECSDRKTSIKNFIAFSKYRDKIRQNKNLASQGCEVLEMTKKFFYDKY